MTFYQELQLSSTGSKQLIKNTTDKKEKRRHILIYNNFSTQPGTPKGPRTPLCVAISEDGIHWKPVLTLEDSPISQYSYPSIIQGKDGRLHAVYTWRRQRVKYAEIDLSKLR